MLGLTHILNEQTIKVKSKPSAKYKNIKHNSHLKIEKHANDYKKTKLKQLNSS